MNKKTNTESTKGNFKITTLIKTWCYDAMMPKKTWCHDAEKKHDAMMLWCYDAKKKKTWCYDAMMLWCYDAILTTNWLISEKGTTVWPTVQWCKLFIAWGKAYLTFYAVLLYIVALLGF